MKSQNRGTNFADLVEKSVISQLLLTVIVFVGTFTIYLVRGTVPDFMIYSCILIVGFFFGAKTEKTLSNTLGGMLKGGGTTTDSRSSANSDSSKRRD